jgi:hypothetical protein
MDSWPPIPPYVKLFAEDSEYLPPPPPKPVEGEYLMFGQHYNTVQKNPTLTEMGQKVSERRRESSFFFFFFFLLALGAERWTEQRGGLAKAHEKCFGDLHRAR